MPPRASLPDGAAETLATRMGFRGPEVQPSAMRSRKVLEPMSTDARGGMKLSEVFSLEGGIRPPYVLIPLGNWGLTRCPTTPQTFSSPPFEGETMKVRG